MNRPSLGQQRLWLLQQLDPASAAYNIPFALRFAGGVDRPALSSALKRLVERHTILTTKFPADADGSPRAIVQDGFDVPIVWAAESSAEDWHSVASSTAVEPFDLTAAPPIRVLVVRCEDGADAVCLVLHHILIDGRSVPIFLRDFAELYRAALSGTLPDLPEPRYTYADHVTWERDRMANLDTSARADYWRMELADLAPLNLPLDFTRPKAPGHEGSEAVVQLPAETTAALQTLAFRWRCAFPSVVLALFDTLMAVYSGQADLATGFVLPGRDRPELEDLVGFFAATSVIRCRIRSDDSLHALARQVNAKVLASDADQALSFEKVVSAVQSDRDASRSPLFDVLFVHHGEVRSTDRDRGVFERLRWSAPVTRYDIELSTTMQDGRLQCVFTYRTDLFEHSTVAGMAQTFVRLAELAASAKFKISA